MNKFCRILYVASNYILLPITLPLGIVLVICTNWKMNKAYGTKGGYLGSVWDVFRGMGIATKHHIAFIKGEIEQNEYEDYVIDAFEEVKDYVNEVKEL